MISVDRKVHRGATAVLTVVAGLVFSVSAAAAPVGKVLAASGSVQAIAANGQARSLAREAAVERGDTLVTGADGSLEVRFVDDALLILRPGARMRVDDYHAEGGTFRSLLNLVSGGLRMLTGQIAKRNREQFKLVTATAVIGVRGTDFELRLCKGDCGSDIKDGLYLGVTRGAIVATNDAGRFELRAHEYGRIDDNKTPLEKLDCPPKALTGVGCQGGKGSSDAAAPPGFRANDEMTSDRLLQQGWCFAPGGTNYPNPKTGGNPPLPACP